MINTKFQQTAFLNSTINFNDYRKNTNPQASGQIQAPTGTQVVQKEESVKQTAQNNKKNIIKWLFEPIPAKQTQVQAQPSTTNRAQAILKGGILILTYGWLFFILRNSLKQMNSFSPLDGKSNNIWQDLSKAMSIDELALPEVLVNTVNNLKNKISNPIEFLNKGGFKKNSSALLYGPPGTGKTTFAKAIAKEFPNSKFASIDLTSLKGSLVGETERGLNSAVDNICKYADKNKESKIFVFIDEIDSFAVEDNGSHNQDYTASVLNTLKMCLSEKLGSRDNVFTFAATNIDIDPNKEIVNSGKKLSKPILDRFTNRIKVDNPTKDQFVVAISNHYSKCPQVDACLKNPSSKEVQELAQKLADNNSSFRTLETLFDNAAAKACAENNSLSFKNIMNALKSIELAEDKLSGKSNPMGFQYQA